MNGPDPRPALIVVDVQDGFVTDQTASTVDLIVEHLARESPRYAQVIATRFINRPGSLYESQRDWHEMMAEPRTRLVRAVAEAAGIVVTKHGLAPDPGDLLPILEQGGSHQVELCGFDTDQCVLATALLLWDAGIVPRVLEPLCSSSGGPDMHAMGLSVLRRAIGDRNVTDVEGRPR